MFGSPNRKLAEMNSKLNDQIVENKDDHTLMKSFKERLQFVYNTKELSDCTFSVGKNEVSIKAHKFVMGLSSPVFKAMFHGLLKENSEKIRVTDIEPQGFFGMLEFMYTDQVLLTSWKQAALTLEAARKYIIPNLEDPCKDYIKNLLNTLIVFEICEFAESLHMDDVSEMCIKHLVKDSTLVVNNKKFMEANLNTVELIVQQNELNITSEVELFKAVEQWAIREAQKREIGLDKLLPELCNIIGNIRFLTMSIDEITSVVEKSPLLSKTDKLLLITNKVQSSLLPYPGRFSSRRELRKKIEKIPILK